MKNKTCGECKNYNTAMFHCEKFDCYAGENECCENFDPVSKPPLTNGDKLRKGSNRELAEIFDDLYNGNKCRYCINNISGNCKFEDKHAEYDEGGWVEDEDCISGFEAWLNAPAESEVNNG